LDASVLLAAIFGFLSPRDERLRASVLAIADELTENGFVLRFRTDETDDGMSGAEGTFTGRLLGNFPQAFSHLALSEAAGRIILAERIREIS
jgi:alpha,alpha-trehalase